MAQRGKRRKTVSSKPNMFSLEALYSVCYVVGVRTARCVKSVGRFTRWLWRPVIHALAVAADILLLRHLRALAKECARIAQGFRLAGDKVHGEHPLVTVLALPILAFRRHRKAVTGIFNIVAPLAAVGVLLATANYWHQADYALALKYGGTSIGYIADEDAYADAVALVRDAVINADGSFAVERAPEMTLSVITEETVLDEQEICDRILESLDGSLVRGAGVYVDSVFQGALSTREQIQEQMDAVLEPHRSDKYDGVGFFDEVEIVEGLYPASALTTAEKLTAYLKKLPIKTVTDITYTETVKYSTVQIQDTSLPLGYEVQVTKGVNGRQKVYAQIIRVDGEEKYRTVVSTEMVKEPVDRVIKVGVQRYSDSSSIGDGVATGTFIWPLPYTKRISSYFSNRWGRLHGAIDIADGSTHGKPIIASDGGVVVEAGWHSSYGYCVLIDHGNGFKTRYAHCSKLEVEAGQKVAQGQYVAKVGNTGYSFGSHLHFEVIKDGKLVDPLDYVQR